MEYRSVVYNAARDGKLNRLKIFLDHKSKEEIGKLVHAKTNGATPLIMACRNGHLEVVKYIIELCTAEIEQVGSVTFDGETIEGAPPLWCAAAAGHLDIVKYLIQKGAGVNKTTYTNSTPLRAACFDGHYEIVKHLVNNEADIEIANRHGHTCLMISCYKGHREIAQYLLELNADVNRKSVKGNTALHDCAESGSLDIMKLLLKHGAKMEKDAYGMTPLMAASVAGFSKIVEFLIGRQECTKHERIDALELLGATYVDKKRDMLGAINFWRQAMEDRSNDPSLPKPKQGSQVAAYENSEEVTNLDELDELISDPDDMRMQALLVRERILGPAHPDTSYYIRYRGALYADMGNFERCIMLWMYALDMQQTVLEPLSPTTQSSFLSFAELFSFMMTEWRNRPAHSIAFKDIHNVLLRAIMELEKGKADETADKDSSHFSRLLVIIMHLLCLMCRLQKIMKKSEEHSFKEVVYKLVRMKPIGTKGFSPLHLACSRETTNVGRYPVCSFPSADVAQLLMDVGADVNAIDLDGNSPLHIASSNRPCRSEVIRTLLRNGAHLDRCNKDRKTPMQLIRGMSINDIVSPLNYLTLQCLSARKIVKCNISYKGQIPKKLENFIEMH
ncbi:Protein fem-1 homolog A-A,Protein fem-1 homolog CG6966,Protein fem-1 homolog A,Protein fem-1 homolog B,Protein fem-1 homolog A-B,Protein fem-1 homolog C [Mytilus edulis]|nr:Protein fem-1 homolog A-A,Protein fem-1 homolog CG6966,Protein fem-1 homolog A,Protein fem-1 homolog B,Protein fem-1 homolog A-B,Protein fem-1 homolog C [Mytilus edulis]